MFSIVHDAVANNFELSAEFNSYSVAASYVRNVEAVEVKDDILACLHLNIAVVIASEFDGVSRISSIYGSLNSFEGFSSLPSPDVSSPPSASTKTVVFFIGATEPEVNIGALSSKLFAALMASSSTTDSVTVLFNCLSTAASPVEVLPLISTFALL